MTGTDKGGLEVAKYVILINWTDQGAHDYTNTLQDLETVAEAFAGAGGKLLDVHWTMGPHDIVAVAEFPDAASATAATLKVNGRGSMRTLLLPAFDREQIARIVG